VRKWAPVAIPSIESAVYSFEGLLPDLESPPIAARRALDHAGLRLSVEGWRSLSTDERERVTLAGVPDRIDVESVPGLLRRASPGPQRVNPVVDPDPSSPPEALSRALEPGRTLDARRWSRLRAVDRYALAHTYRRAVARSAFSLLGEALDAVVAAAATSDAAPITGRRTHAYSPSLPPMSQPGFEGPAAGARPRAASEPAANGASRPPSAYQPAGYYSTITPPEPREALPRDRSSSRPPPPRSDAPGGHDGGSSSTPPVNPRAESRGPATLPPPPITFSNHLTAAGEVHMVDVARKPQTERRAVAGGSVRMRPETVARLVGRDAPKGEVLATARIAAIMAAKRTHELIPLCHAVALTHLEVNIDVDPAGSTVHVTAVAEAHDRTGCEMEAMVAVTTACLTIYDMLKGIDRAIVITDVRLLEKSGGRSGHYQRADDRS